MDSELSHLERRAYSGDYEAGQKLIAKRIRAGLPAVNRGEIVVCKPSAVSTELYWVASELGFPPNKHYVGFYVSQGLLRPNCINYVKETRLDSIIGFADLSNMEIVSAKSRDQEIPLPLRKEWTQLCKNPDEDIRNLERRAYAGDAEASRKLIEERKRRELPIVNRGEVIKIMWAGSGGAARDKRTPGSSPSWTSSETYGLAIGVFEGDQEGVFSGGIYDLITAYVLIAGKITYLEVLHQPPTEVQIIGYEPNLDFPIHEKSAELLPVLLKYTPKNLKRNPDEDIRSLERRVYAGEADLSLKLMETRMRHGLPALKRYEIIKKWHGDYQVYGMIYMEPQEPHLIDLAGAYVLRPNSEFLHYADVICPGPNVEILGYEPPITETVLIDHAHDALAKYMPNQKRRNPDVDIRALERRAYSGDPTAGQQLIQTRLRHGLHGVKEHEIVKLNNMSDDMVEVALIVLVQKQKTFNDLVHLVILNNQYDGLCSETFVGYKDIERVIGATVPPNTYPFMREVLQKYLDEV